MSDLLSIDEALAHYAEGRLASAVEICEQLLQRNPDDADALHLLAVIGCQQVRYHDAAALAARAIAAGGRQASVHNTLGMAHLGGGRLDEAEASFREAIRLDPDFWLGHDHLACVLCGRGRFEDALASHFRALALAPDAARLHVNMGRTLGASGDVAGAARCFARAAELAPDDPLVHTEWGDALQTLGQIADAARCYDRALALDGTLVRAWYALGCALAREGDHAEAIDAFGRAVALAPEHGPAYHNLGRSLMKLGLVEPALDAFHHAAALDTGPLPALARAVVIPGSPATSPQEILDARRAWAATIRQPRDAMPRHTIDTRRRPLRLGYVSAFFHKPNWMKPVWGLINQHDRQQFEIHLFSDAPASRLPGGYRRVASDRVHDTSQLSNRELAALIAQQGIDILVDLNGYSAPERLPVFALHPAPVVVGWFNMYATTGLEAFDYLIGDAHVIRPGEGAFFTERLVCVPGSYLTFEVGYPVPDVGQPPCLRRGAITFGSLASQYKITPQVIATWSTILRACPGSRLVLKNAELGSAGNRRFVARLFGEARVAERQLELEGPAEHREFLRTYDEIDLALDPFPYNGGTTTTEAIWQGVPVLTFAGDRWASRTSASLLRSCHLSSFVADSLEAHVRQAIEWATQPERWNGLAELRAGMRDRLRASPVCDTTAFARHMEAEYFEMWEAAGTPA